MDESLLVYYFREWERFTLAMTYINNIFHYLVRFGCCKRILMCFAFRIGTGLSARPTTARRRFTRCTSWPSSLGAKSFSSIWL
jgi:hypothetical protein